MTLPHLKTTRAGSLQVNSADENFPKSDIIQYRQDVAAFKPEDFWRELEASADGSYLFCESPSYVVQPLVSMAEV